MSALAGGKPSSTAPAAGYWAGTVAKCWVTAFASRRELSGGFRVDRWKNESENLDTMISSDTDDVEFLPRASLALWLNEDHMLYFTFAEGFEPGGFNIANLGGLGETFEPERPSSFEIGWKGKSADGRLTASLAAFFIDYEGRQVEFQATVNGQLIEGINNGGDSENVGIEAEAMWRVNDWVHRCRM